MSTKQKRRKKRQRQKIRIIILNLIILILFVIIGLLLMEKIVPATHESLQSIFETDPFEVKYSERELNKFETVSSSSVYTYGEILNIDFDKDITDNTLTLLNTTYKEQSLSFKLSEAIDVGIDLNAMPIGSFFLQTTDGKLVTTDQDLNLSFNTITRNGASNPITITKYNDSIIQIIKEEPTDEITQTDILIDPGHGGSDGGSESYDGSITEAELNLQVATVVASKLTDLGYNVQMTRTDDTQPGETDGLINAYQEGGRVSQSFEQQAKLVVSIHHNTGGGRGFEVYSSTYSSHALATLIRDNLLEVSDPSSRITDQIANGLYVQTYTDGGHLQDYMYMIREVGGLATKSTNEENDANNKNQEGAEGVLVELGYLDDATDLAHVTNTDVIDQEAEAIANAVDSYLNTDATNIVTNETTDSE